MQHLPTKKLFITVATNTKCNTNLQLQQPTPNAIPTFSYSNQHQMQYQPSATATNTKEPKRSRSRNILWYNPPFSKKCENQHCQKIPQPNQAQLPKRQHLAQIVQSKQHQGQLLLLQKHDQHCHIPHHGQRARACSFSHLHHLPHPFFYQLQFILHMLIQSTPSPAPPLSPPATPYPAHTNMTSIVTATTSRLATLVPET